MFTIKKTVCYSDLGTDGFIAPGSIVDFLQDCGTFHMYSLDFIQHFFKEHNMNLFLAYVQTDIKKYSNFGDELTINTWIYEMNNLFGVRNYTIYDNHGDLCVCSYAVGVFVNSTTGRPTKISDEILNKNIIEPKYDMEYTSRKIILPKEDPILGETIKIRHYHLDENNHVNNARYVDIACESLEEGFKPKRIRSEYKTPAILGQNIKPEIYKTEKETIVSLSNQNDKPYAIIAFS